MSNDDQDPGELDTPTETDDILEEDAYKSDGESDADCDEQEQNGQEYESESTKQYQTNYNVDSGNIASIVGDNHQVTINYYLQTFQEVEKASLRHDDDAMPKRKKASGKSAKQPGIMQNKYIDNLQFESENATFFTHIKVGEIDLPQADEELTLWYYGLSEYERCYVQAVAVLHGAPAHQVSKKAETLYLALYNDTDQQKDTDLQSLQKENQNSTQLPIYSSHTDLMLQRKPGRDLRSSTHTLTRRVNGVERLFWKDVDAYGLSIFGLRLLVFLADEFANRGQHGQSFLDTLDKWSTEQYSECSLPASRAYGVVLWYQHAGELHRVARKWVKIKSALSQRRIASLLDGAYAIDYELNDIQANDPKISPVLQLLNDWTKRVNQQLNSLTSSMGCATANTYGLIGKQSPDIALAGLACLLQFTDSKANDDTNDVFAAGVSTYVSLIWSGHIRKVIEHLAEMAERLSHQRCVFDTIQERQRYRQQRDVQLNSILEAFFLIAGASYAEAFDDRLAFYTVTDSLPTQPAIPDSQKRDVLLAGLLVEDEVSWREQILTLLCAAIIERRSAPAFDLMRRWATIVLRMQQLHIKSAQRVYIQFQHFMIQLGQIVDSWCRDIGQGSRRSPQALLAYRYRLEQWQTPGQLHPHSLSNLAQEILKQFDKESILFGH